MALTNLQANITLDVYDHDVAEAVEKVGDLETDVAQIKERFYCLGRSCNCFGGLTYD